LVLDEFKPEGARRSPIAFRLKLSSFSFPRTVKTDKKAIINIKVRIVLIHPDLRSYSIYVSRLTIPERGDKFKSPAARNFTGLYKK
jgi:hypothetical protein